MSKSFFIASAFLIAFLLISSPVLAQSPDYKDYEGIEPGTAPTATTPTITTPTLSRAEIITNLKAQEMAGFQATKDKYIAAINSQEDPSAVNSALTYKLNAILISARYHKTLEAYLTYLQLADQGIQTANNATGFGTDESEKALDKATQEMTKISTLLIAYDAAVDAFPGTLVTDISMFAPQIGSTSDAAKMQISTTKATLLNLVSMME
jgi:hypothetical protein